MKTHGAVAVLCTPKPMSSSFPWQKHRGPGQPGHCGSAMPHLGNPGATHVGPETSRLLVPHRHGVLALSWEKAGVSSQEGGCRALSCGPGARAEVQDGRKSPGQTPRGTLLLGPSPSSAPAPATSPTSARAQTDTAPQGLCTGPLTGHSGRRPHHRAGRPERPVCVLSSVLWLCRQALSFPPVSGPPHWILVTDDSVFKEPSDSVLTTLTPLPPNPRCPRKS